ncbi:MAG: archaeal proteasome endopeptidase complex subunit beta [Deltaproteobacteria bacterium]|nr:archaeal proteasome endopeptidase complex subunit beta [Deltaproteobacteria bacterium]
MEKGIEKLKTGTTTVGAIGVDAVVLGADRKATMGYLVASKDAKKVLQLDDHIAMTIAGVVGDAQALERYIKAEFRLFELREKSKISIKSASNLVANILYSRRFYPYIVQLLVGGHDGKPGLFSFDPSGGMSDENEYFSTGSGSVMALGVLEDKYKKGMTTDELKRLVARAVSAATKRDIASGGSGIDLVVIDSKGFHRISDREVNKYIS